MVEGARNLRMAVLRGSGHHPEIKVIKRSAIGLEHDRRLQGHSPKLIQTSPPYPGVHVLYHRWQVDGRKEAPFPFMIANKLDGAGQSYYTMGDRKYPALKTYFDNIRITFRLSASSGKFPRITSRTKKTSLRGLFRPFVLAQPPPRTYRLRLLGLGPLPRRCRR